MSAGYPRLLGDIGGTHARWAWLPSADAPIQQITVERCEASPTLAASAASYLARHGLGRPASVCIGIATPVQGDQVRMTNHHWSFSIRELAQALGVEHCLVINDFTALAMSLPALGPQDLQTLGGVAGVADAPLALLGPGTGLGVSGLLRGAQGGWTALSGEGGHITLAAADDEEAAVIGAMRRRLGGHVSAERALSGPGLVNLYDALCDVHGLVRTARQPADVTAAAVRGDDPTCVAAVRLFASFLGNVAGNLALTLGALGGVYVGGGIVPRLEGAFDRTLFRRRFEDKGRFATYLQPVPAWLITAPTPALLGAARALDAAQR